MWARHSLTSDKEKGYRGVESKKENEMRILNARRLCEERGIPYWTDGYKQCRPGWIQLDCPFCVGNVGPHLGYDEQQGYFNCWRCGSHSTVEVVATVLHVRQSEARQIVAQYEGFVKGTATERAQLRVSRRRQCALPQGTGPLRSPHKAYLRRRSFDPDTLEALWALQGTANLGPYKFRIIAPIFDLHGRLVSYQGRDYTGKSELRYKACQEDLEARRHKDMLYGQWLANKDWVVIVEGITDVWRLGRNAVATFGIKYRPTQLAKLRNYSRRFVLFDHSDSQARKQAKRLASELATLPGNVWHVDIVADDPANMTQADADALMHELEHTT